MKLRSLFALFFTVCIFSQQVSADMTDQEKLNMMIKLENESSDGVVRIPVDKYEELVIRNPRPYDTVIYYTVDRGCDDCLATYNEFVVAAYSFKQVKDKIEEKGKRVFFGAVYYGTDSRTRRLFDSHNFNTVPYLAVSEQVAKRFEN